MQKITLTIDGMHCPKCSGKVETAIADKFSVKSVSASHTDKTAVIRTDVVLDDESLTSLVAALGFTVTDIKREEEKQGFFQKLFKK